MFFGAGLGGVLILMLVGMWTLHILVAAHIFWMVKFSIETWKYDEPLWTKIARIFAVTVTPIVGFYAVEARRYYHTPPSERAAVKKSSLILPAIFSILLVLGPVNAMMRPEMEGQRLVEGTTVFLTMSAYYLALYLPHHMLAKLLTISSHGPILSRVHVLPLAMTAALVFLS